MISTPYDQIAKEFEAARNQLQPKEFDYLAVVEAPLASSGTILDLGCGTGQPIATHLANRGHCIVGVDASAAMLTFARARLPEHRWIHQFMETVEFDETFDAVVCWDSLFHLPRREHPTVIRKIHQWLRPGGRLMISAAASLKARADSLTSCSGTSSITIAYPPRA